MTFTPIQTLPVLPDPPNTATDNKAAFIAKADAWNPAVQAWGSAFNVQVPNINEIATYININLPVLETVNTNIASINLVSTNITDVNTVSTNMPKVDTVSTNINDVKTCSDNMTAIIAAPYAAQRAETAAEQAEAARDEAHDIANVGPATTVKLGLVKMDGKTTPPDAGGVVTVKDVAINGDLGDLASARGIFNTLTKESVDCNTLTNQGVYAISLAETVNGPGFSAKLIVFNGKNSKFTNQMALAAGAGTSGAVRVAYRARNSEEIWSTWSEGILSGRIGDGLTVNNGIISVPEMQGATASTPGTSGLVPPAAAGQQESFLTGGGEYKRITSLDPVSEKSQALGTISGTVTIDLSAGLSVSATVGGAVTLAFSNAPVGGAVVVVLRLTNGGAYTVTWPSTIKWPGDTAPTLTESGADLVVLTTSDGGTTWLGTTTTGYAG